MSDQSVYIYVKDKNHQLTQEQKDQAFELFDSNTTEGDFEPCLIKQSSYQLEHTEDDEDGIVIESPFIMTAGNFSGTNEFWILSEDEEDAEIDSSNHIRPEMKKKLEEILGAEIAVVWGFRD
ncbi:hypothetical protein [Faucicola boevrei]|uniref:hypothetical protein n=1 Tax=Faucicola boevrei TaxID=346665 RepID=UPI0003651A06|nr:hypothetical protein [Moraxella boevrei]